MRRRLGNCKRPPLFWALLLGVLAVAATATAGTAAAATTTPGLSTVQRSVPDVAAQFDALALRPDGLAFDWTGSGNPSKCKHYQSIVRKDGPDGTPYLFITKSGNSPFGCLGDDDPGNLIVVRMGSRDKNGERLRSNRLRRNWAVGYDPTFLNTPPDARDVVAKTITFDGGAGFPAYGATSGWPAYGHPGAMQLVGDVLAVALETPYEGAPAAAIMFLDVSNPEAPRFLSQMSPGAVTDDFAAGTIGITPVKAANGACCDYLMVVLGKSNRLLKLWKSFPTGGATTTDLASSEIGWIPLEDYTESQLEANGCLGRDWPSGSGEGHQTLAFVREGGLDGQLYLVGARNNVPTGIGDDILELYRMRSPITSDCPFTQVRSKRVATYPVAGYENSANFAAGSGVYVSPSGELIVYATDYANVSYWSSFVEFRHRNMVRPDSPTLHPTAAVGGPFAVDEGSSVALTGTGAPPITQAWIQLFEDDGAGATIPTQTGSLYDSDWWLAIDYVDRLAENYDDLDAMDVDTVFGFDLDFEENADSWRWWAPVGCTISANDEAIQEDDFPGENTMLLAGTGEVVEDSNPANDDEIAGVTFFHVNQDGARVHDCEGYYNAPISLGWDLDANGSFEVDGDSTTFDAAALDGPTTANVAARATHPTDPTLLGVGAPVPVPVTVRNVAPRIGSAAVRDPLGYDVSAGQALAIVGLPLKLEVTFTDPGLADTQTAVVSWGDGSTETSFDSYTDARAGATGRLEDRHVFGSPGTYAFTATITDDDGGATPVTLTVQVLSLTDAVETVADELTALIEGATDAAAAAALRAARDDLIGNHAGHPPTNGALDKLDADDPIGAITKLRAALANLLLAEARGAGDLSALKDFLGLVAAAIATGRYSEAEAAVAPPSAGEARALARIAALIAQGQQLLASGAYLDACDSFRRATERAVDLAG